MAAKSSLLCSWVVAVCCSIDSKAAADCYVWRLK